MKTMMYVPEGEQTEKYFKEAELWGIEICHGIPPKVLEEFPDITPPKASIVKIPEIRNLPMRCGEIPTGHYQSILLVDEYIDLRDGDLSLDLVDNRKKETVFEGLKPQWTERSRARWSFMMESLGRYTAKVMLDSDEISCINFYAFKRLA